MQADVGVIGLGAMGSMALWHLAARGISAIGVERFVPGHNHGSSHGESRIIRTAYAEGAEYVPLLRAAFGRWRQLERESGTALLEETGGLMIGRPGSSLISGVLASARLHDLEHRVLDVAQIRRLHPQHAVDSEDVAVFEEQAGFLRPEAAVRAATARAAALGATVLDNSEVATIEPGQDGVTIVTEAGARLHVRHAVLAVGAWTNGFLPDAALPLVVERNVQVWFEVDDPAAFAPSRFPVFIRELAGDETRPYGFPSTDGRSIKLAMHHTGQATGPDDLDRDVHAADLAPLQSFAAAALHGVTARAVQTRACMYTNTPDESFVVGSLPGIPNVTVISACSGHGFKFAPIIGEIAADLATQRQPAYDISHFSPERFAAQRAVTVEVGE